MNDQKQDPRRVLAAWALLARWKADFAAISGTGDSIQVK